MSLPGPGHCGQTDVPISPAIPCPNSALPWATLPDCVGSIHQDLTLLEFRADSPNVHIRGVVGGTHFTGVIFPMITFVRVMLRQALRFLRQISTWKKPGCSSHMEQLAKEMQAAGEPALALRAYKLSHKALKCLFARDIYGPKWTNGDPPGVVHMCPFTSSRWNSLDTVGLEVVGLTPWPEVSPTLCVASNLSA